MTLIGKKLKLKYSTNKYKTHKITTHDLLEAEGTKIDSTLNTKTL